MSKKDEAFRLFGEGKRPSDPEVKALGLSAKTRYNYFQESKKSLESNGSGASEIQELRQTKIRLTLLSQIEELEAGRARLPDQIDKLGKQIRQIARWMDENEFENIKAHYFIGECLIAVKHRKTINEDSLKDIMEDAEKYAITSEREDGKYVDKIEGV